MSLFTSDLREPEDFRRVFAGEEKMKHVKKHRHASCNRKKLNRIMIRGKLLREVARKVMWILMALFAYLGYYVEIRPYFEDNHGIWSVGFLDGVVVISTLFIIGFYIWSTSNVKR